MDGSGIWDTPYVDDRYEEDISCIDYHPLISPVAIPAFPEPTPTLEPTPTPTQPSVVDPVTLLNGGKVALPGEETPPPSGEKTEFETQLQAGNRLAELYNKGGK